MIVTKGLGSDRLITQGYGYAFGWHDYVRSVASGSGGGANYYRGQPTSYAARRPRRGKWLPYAESNEAALVASFLAASPVEEPQAVRQPAAFAGAAEPAPAPARRPADVAAASTPSWEAASTLTGSAAPKGLSTGWKAAIAVGATVLCGTAFYLLWQTLKPKIVKRSTTREKE